MEHREVLVHMIPRIGLLLGLSLIALLPVAQAGPPNGYDCASGYNPDAFANICVGSEETADVPLTVSPGGAGGFCPVGHTCMHLPVSGVDFEESPTPLPDHPWVWVDAPGIDLSPVDPWFDDYFDLERRQEYLQDGLEERKDYLQNTLDRFLTAEGRDAWVDAVQHNLNCHTRWSPVVESDGQSCHL